MRLEETGGAHDQHQRQLHRNGNLGDAPHPPVLRQLQLRRLDETELGCLVVLLRVVVLVLVLVVMVRIGQRFHLRREWEVLGVGVGVQRLCRAGLGAVRFGGARGAVLFAVKERGNDLINLTDCSLL